MHSDEQSVMARFRDGDEAAVREIYRLHAGAIHTVARSMVRDPELVAEVVQQTFVKAWPGVAGFDDARPLAPWLYAIARRTAVDVLRREGRHQDVVSLDDGPQERPEASVEPVTFEKTWEVFEVRQALDDLPADEREVVRLSHLVGLTHVEIADRLGVPVGTVKSRSARAHRRLAATLAHLRPAANQSRSSDVQEGKETRG